MDIVKGNKELIFTYRERWIVLRGISLEANTRISFKMNKYS